MRQLTLRWGAFLLVTALCVPLTAAEPKEKKDAKDAKDKAPKLIPMGQAVGVLRSAEGQQKYITVGVYTGYTQSGPRETNIEFSPADEMEVRTMFPPQAFDDKGNPKKYNAKELRELRGKSKLPGYTAEMDALKSGQIVRIYMARPPRPTNKKDKDKDELADNKPIITAIIVLGEGRGW